jgi:hypothetical protein
MNLLFRTKLPMKTPPVSYLLSQSNGAVRKFPDVTKTTFSCEQTLNKKNCIVVLCKDDRPQFSSQSDLPVVSQTTVFFHLFPEMEKGMSRKEFLAGAVQRWK